MSSEILVEGLTSMANATFDMKNATEIVTETLAFVAEQVVTVGKENLSDVVETVLEVLKTEVPNIVPIVENVASTMESAVLDSDPGLWHPYWTLRDQRMDGMLFMNSPWPVAAICLSYYVLVRFIGPAFMKDRPAYDVKKFMLAYNFFQTFFSFWIFSGTCYFFLTGRYNWICESVDYSDSEDGVYAANLTWWYFFSKFTDFFDTFFFILRLKFNQCSTLHVVHHGIMPFTTWWVARFVGGGQSLFAGFLNMGIHTLMYFYYGMSALGPAVQKHLWWKKYLTSMQLVQFVLVFTHANVPLFHDCDFPKVFSWVILGHGALFFVLFSNFYVQSYMKKSSKKISSDPKITTNGAQTNGVQTNGDVKKEN